jgi:hypothetical protein
MRVEQATEKAALREWKLDEGVSFRPALDPDLALDLHHRPRFFSGA